MEDGFFFSIVVLYGPLLKVLANRYHPQILGEILMPSFLRRDSFSEMQLQSFIFIILYNFIIIK